MMSGGGFAGSIGYIVPLSILTGIFLIRWETAGYEKTKMKKEKKVARAFGWVNVAAGIGLYVGNMIFDKLS